MYYVVNTQLHKTKRFIIFPLLGLFTKLAKLKFISKYFNEDKHFYLTVVRMPIIDRLELNILCSIYMIFTNLIIAEPDKIMLYLYILIKYF